MTSLAIVDANVLIAALDRAEPHHASCAEMLRRRDLQLIIPALVVAEVAYYAAARLGAQAESAFVRSLDRLEIEAPLPEDWPKVAELVERYADFPLGTVDASLAVLADRLDTDLILTLDRRHFGAIRSPRGRRFRLLPEIGQAVHEEAGAYAEPSA